VSCDFEQIAPARRLCSARSALEMVHRTISFAQIARTGPHPAHAGKSLAL